MQARGFFTGPKNLAELVAARPFACPARAAPPIPTGWPESWHFSWKGRRRSACPLCIPATRAWHTLPPANSSKKPFPWLPTKLLHPRNSDDVRHAGQDVIGRGRTGHGQGIARGTDAMHVLQRLKFHQGRGPWGVGDQAPDGVQAVQCIGPESWSCLPVGSDGFGKKPVKVGGNVELTTCG